VLEVAVERDYGYSSRRLQAREKSCLMAKIAAKTN
jgi:hypothetical protein